MSTWLKCFLSAIAGAVIVGAVVWLLKPCPKPTVTLPSVPIHDTLTITDVDSIPYIRWRVTTTVAKETVYVTKEIANVHLISESRPEYGLDSVTVDYLYPPGWRQFVFWPADSLEFQTRQAASPLLHLPRIGQILSAPPLLVYGAVAGSRWNQNNQFAQGYAALRVKQARFEVGWMTDDNNWPGWYLALRYERKIL